MGIARDPGLRLASKLALGRLRSETAAVTGYGYIPWTSFAASSLPEQGFGEEDYEQSFIEQSGLSLESVAERRCPGVVDGSDRLSRHLHTSQDGADAAPEGADQQGVSGLDGPRLSYKAAFQRAPVTVDSLRGAARRAGEGWWSVAVGCWWQRRK